MKSFEAVRLLKEYLDGVVIGTSPPDASCVLKQNYPNLTIEQFGHKRFVGIYSLCQELSEEFTEQLVQKTPAVVQRFIVYSHLIRHDEVLMKGFNRTYIELLLKNAYSAMTFLTAYYLLNAGDSAEVATHTLLKVDDLLVDILSGVVYPYESIEMLLELIENNPEQYLQDFIHHNDLNWLMTNIHYHRNTLMFTTPMYWKSVFEVKPIEEPFLIIDYSYLEDMRYI